MLTPGVKKYLRGRAHALKPTVLIGKEGVTDTVLAEIERTAASAELIKIRVLRNAPVDAAAAEAALSPRLSGEIVGRLGHTLVYFRAAPEGTRFPLDAIPNRGESPGEP